MFPIVTREEVDSTLLVMTIKKIYNVF